MPGLRPLTPLQEQLLAALAAQGGACGWSPLVRAATGLPAAQLSTADRNHLAQARRGLAARDLVTLDRQWGTMGYGQIGLVRLTDRGRAHPAATSRP
jgi:hypothetical protein